MKFDTSLLLNLFAAAAMLVMGFRSFSKKHQMKFSDDEERAMWEKKFGVFYSLMPLCLPLRRFCPTLPLAAAACSLSALLRTPCSC